VDLAEVSSGANVCVSAAGQAEGREVGSGEMLAHHGDDLWWEVEDGKGLGGHLDWRRLDAFFASGECGKLNVSVNAEAVV
jgi:hypothetical protein